MPGDSLAVSMAFSAKFFSCFAMFSAAFASGFASGVVMFFAVSLTCFCFSSNFSILLTKSCALATGSLAFSIIFATSASIFSFAASNAFSALSWATSAFLSSAAARVLAASSSAASAFAKSGFALCTAGSVVFKISLVTLAMSASFLATSILASGVLGASSSFIFSLISF